MKHASTDPRNDGQVASEYGDHSGIMDHAGYYQVNGPHHVQIIQGRTFTDTAKHISIKMSRAGLITAFVNIKFTQ